MGTLLCPAGPLFVDSVIKNRYPLPKHERAKLEVLMNHPVDGVDVEKRHSPAVMLSVIVPVSSQHQRR